MGGYLARKGPWDWGLFASCEDEKEKWLLTGKVGRTKGAPQVPPLRSQ